MNDQLKNLRSPRSDCQSPRGFRGFSLIECVVAMLVLLIASLAVISVFDYAFQSGQSSRRRFAAAILAEQRMEDVRNLNFVDLTAGTVSEQGVISDGVECTVVRTIADNDTLTVATAAGPETKRITISVMPVGGTSTADNVILTTVRSKNAPGPNRKPNTP